MLKRLLIIAIALLVFAVPSIVYADVQMEYDIYIDGTEQAYDAILVDWTLYLPIKKTYEGLGGTLTRSTDGLIETIILADKKMELNSSTKQLKVSGNGETVTIDCFDIDGELFISSYSFQHRMKNIVIPVDDKEQLHILTLEGTEKKLEKRNEAFKVQSPELYAAFEQMILTPYEFNYNVNTNIKMIPATEEAAASLPFRKLFFNVYANGYINIPKDKLDIKMNLKLDTGPTFRKSIEGIKVILIKNMMYLYDPESDDWDSEKIAELDQYKKTKAIFTEGNNASAWLLVDHLTKTVGTDGSTTYKAILKEDEIRVAIDAVTFEGFYQLMMDILEEERTIITIEKIEFLYVVKDGKVTAQHIEADIDMSVEGVAMDLNISGDGEFYSYGLEKDILLPREFRPSLQAK